MDFQDNIPVTSLKAGDILLMEDKMHRFFRNVAVVTQVDQQTNDCKAAYWRGTRYPYSLAETSLPSEKMMQERRLMFHVFRPKDQALAQRAATLLQKWCLWAVPFDKTRFEEAEKYHNHFFDMNADFLNWKMPVISNDDIYNENLIEHCLKLNKAFKEYYLDIVKYAARREISPVRPTAENEEKQTGFHCVQGILIAFQVACVEDFVKPQNTQWLTNKENKPFKPVKKLLKSHFDQKDFLNKIPLPFQLWAKFASIDAFHLILKTDDKNILSLGTLAPQTPERADDFDKREYENITLAYQIGLQKRTKLLNEVIISQKKPEDLKTKVLRKCSQFF